MSETRRRILDAIDAGPITGPTLATRLDITRVAVWNHIDALREEGFEIDATPHGYVLEAIPAYGEAALSFGLDCPATVEYHESIGSTNERARQLAAAGKSDVAVVANEQLTGRGRLDREWAAPPGGIYASLLLRPSLTPVEAPILTMAAAVAAVDAIAPTGIDAHIKWPNDLMVASPTGEEKLGGVLTAVEGEADRLAWAIVGIGLNANIDASTLPAGATSLQTLRGERVDRRGIVQRLLDEIYRHLDATDTVLPAWRDAAGTLGRQVRVQTATELIEGRAIDVVAPGALLVETEDETVRVHAGDCEHLRPVTSDG